MTANVGGRPVFLTARWRHLVMLNYEVDPAVLVPHIPAGTELDDYHGRYYVSVVGFRFLDTRVLGVPVPFHRDFDEVNLRFYVRRDEAGEKRRGVVFIKEIVPKRAIAWVAWKVYNENYAAMPMRHEIDVPGADPSAAGVVGYGWRSRRGWNRMRVSIAGPARLPDDDSAEAFIAEHYWGYARQRNGAILAYRVDHPRWKVWPARSVEFDCDVQGLYGGALAGYLAGEPNGAFVADGSEVIVRRGVAVTRAVR